ncbi:MAG: hypothetical protein KIG14_02795 [Candidatus Sacchiramonaceae bacterium]|nr:hypothetical protein [Candidatus Saccharimonadaceae bacterium]
MSAIFRLGGDSIAVNIDNFGQICDIFIPQLGRNILPSNQTIHKIGIFIDDICLWLDDKSWTINTQYDSSAATVKTEAINQRYQIKLCLADVASDGQILRKIKIEDLSGQDRQLKFFVYQNFILADGALNPDTAQIIDNGSAALHYNASTSIVTRLESRAETGYHSSTHYTVGIFGVNGLEGSWRDAEDGVLSGSKAEQGQADSTLGIDLDLPADGSRELQYSLVYDEVQSQAVRLSYSLKSDLFKKQYLKFSGNAHKWLAKSNNFVKQIEPTLQKSFTNNLNLLKTSISGGFVLDKNISSVSTTRNAIFSIWPLIRLGYKAESLEALEKYIDLFTRDNLIRPAYLNGGRIAPSNLPYFTIQDQEFPPISFEDSAALLFMIGEYCQKFHDQDFLERNYKIIIKPLADLLNSSIGKEGKLSVSYDLWSGQLESTTFAYSLVYAALNSASLTASKLRKVKDATNWRSTSELVKDYIQAEMWNGEQGYFYRAHNSDGTKDSRIDPMSLYGIYMFGTMQYDSPQVSLALETLQSSLPNIYFTRSLAPIAERYEILPSLWLAEILIDQGRKDEAVGILNYVSNTIESDSNIPTWVRAEFLSVLLDTVS